jgi:hypothetical protein
MLQMAKKLLLSTLVTLITLAALTGVARANAYTVNVAEGQTFGNGFNTTNLNPFTSGSNTASATFTYTGSINFANTNPQNSGPSGDLNSTFGYTAGNVSNYHGSGTVSVNSTQVADFSSLTSFLNSSGSASNSQYATWISFDLGTLSAGTVLTVTHDDGASVYQNGLSLGQTISGETTQVTDTVRLGGSADTMLYYSRQNGSPSILQVSVPEPSSIVLLLAGLVGIILVRHRLNQIQP